MKKILFLLCFIGLNEAIPLEDFVNNDTDLNIRGYTLINTMRENLLTKYYLNLTTFAWFESKSKIC